MDNALIVKGVSGRISCNQEVENRFSCGEPAQFQVKEDGKTESYCIHCLNNRVKSRPEIAVAILVECHKYLSAQRIAAS